MAENKKISDLHTIVQLHDDDEFVIIDKSTKTGADASGSGKTTKLKVWQLKQELVTSGEKGQKGSTGPEGPQGADGANGRDGRDGFDGQKGEPGARGRDGVVGRDGIDGTNGAKGDKGQQGERGIDGNASDGVKGEQGPKGEPGAPGADGARGRDGVNGDDGAKGQKGNVGQQGSQGPSGSDGKSGEKGAPGVNGTPGAKGQKGVPGTNGRNGSNGANGATGKKGDKGSPSEKWAWRNVPNQSKVVQIRRSSNMFPVLDVSNYGVPASATKIVLDIRSGESYVYRWRGADWHIIHTGVNNGSRHNRVTIPLERDHYGTAYRNERQVQLHINFAPGDDRDCHADIRGVWYYGPE